MLHLELYNPKRSEESPNPHKQVNPLENCTSLGNCIKRAQWNWDQMNNFPHNPPPISISHLQTLFLVPHRGSLPAITLGWMFPRESKAHGNSVPLAFLLAQLGHSPGTNPAAGPAAHSLVP